MSTVTTDEQLEEAMAAAELTDEEREQVRHLIEDSDATAEEAIASAIAIRDAEPPPAAAAATEQRTSEPTDKQLNALDKENDRHVKRVHEIMGHFVEAFEPCEKCGTMGLMEPGGDPLPHAFFIPCPTCNAWGKVLTGSRNEEHAARPCPDCLERGYLEAMIDNTPAVEIVERMREQARLVSPLPLEPSPPAEPVAGAALVTHGRPAWMGDASISS